MHYTIYWPSSMEGARINSFAECEGLDTFGRFSFNGFNKDIEVDFVVLLRTWEITIFFLLEVNKIKGRWEPIGHGTRRGCRYPSWGSRSTVCFDFTLIRGNLVTWLRSKQVNVMNLVAFWGVWQLAFRSCMNMTWPHMQIVSYSWTFTESCHRTFLAIHMNRISIGEC